MVLRGVDHEMQSFFQGYVIVLARPITRHFDLGGRWAVGLLDDAGAHTPVETVFVLVMEVRARRILVAFKLCIVQVSPPSVVAQIPAAAVGQSPPIRVASTRPVGVFKQIAFVRVLDDVVMLGIEATVGQEEVQRPDHVIAAGCSVG